MQLATESYSDTPPAAPAPVTVPHSVPPSLTEDAFLGGKLSILQPEKGYRAGIDAVFLGAAIPVKEGETVFEAGIGVGVASLCLLSRCNNLHVTGMEVTARYAMMCEENAKRNGFGNHVRVIHAGARQLQPCLCQSALLRRRQSDAIAFAVEGASPCLRA
jgi:tRNA1(Val) A37 N6-methylase TrmN6